MRREYKLKPLTSEKTAQKNIGRSQEHTKAQQSSLKGPHDNQQANEDQEVGAQAKRAP